MKKSAAALFGSFLFLLFVVPFPAQNPSGSAKITGTIKFSGDAPKRRAIDMGGDAKCHAMHKEKVVDESIIVNKNGTLQNVFVWIRKGVTGKYSPPAEPFVLDQKGCTYVPHVAGVMTGQKVLIRNSDPVLHNVHSFSQKNTAFNEGQTTGAKDIEKVFKTQEVMITVKCDVHGWMSSYLGVVDHPFFAVTGEAGTFEIKGLPAGQYTLEAWHEVLGKQKAEITVADGEAKVADFSFKEE